MLDADRPSAKAIRAARLEDPKLRDRDLAHSLNITEAQLVAAHVGHGVTCISAAPSALIPLVGDLGEVLALTRNESCVNERVGTYNNFRSGAHAAMVLDKDIDLRIFPKHWVHGFAVEKETPDGMRRSLQVFDEAGDAVHKIHMRDTSDLAAWGILVGSLRLEQQSDRLDVTPRQPVEAAKPNPEKLEVLRSEWDKMTDTHQFMRLTSKLRMNRLGAYHIVGAPYVRPVVNTAVEQALKLAAERSLKIMVFVGNRGCIQIHNGAVENIKPMGPWINVMDDRFNLHLRGDHINETYVVTKPTQRGPAISLEGFDKDGWVVFQIFPDRRAGEEHVAGWAKIMADLQEVPA